MIEILGEYYTFDKDDLDPLPYSKEEFLAKLESGEHFWRYSKGKWEMMWGFSYGYIEDVINLMAQHTIENSWSCSYLVKDQMWVFWTDRYGDRDFEVFQSYNEYLKEVTLP